MRRFVVLVAAVMLAMLLPAAPVTAAPPLGVTITVDEMVVDLTPEAFTAGGDAVEEGVICAAGTVVDLGFTVHGKGKHHTNLIVDKEFTCPDRGTFTARLWVKLFPDGFTTATWKVTGGTDDFASLRGSGKLVGTPIPDEETGEKVGITDVYTGKLKG